MISRIPYQLPLFDRPFAVVIGGQSELVARQLESTFDSVVIAAAVDPANMGGGDVGLYLHVLDMCLDQARAILVWLDDSPCWLWLELGALLERSPARLAVGMPEAAAWHHTGHFKMLAERRGVHVFDNLDDVITATKQRRVMDVR